MTAIMKPNKWLLADYTSRHRILEFYNLIGPKLPSELRLICERKPYSKRMSVADSLLFWNSIGGETRRLSYDGYYSALLPQLPPDDTDRECKLPLDRMRRVWGGGSLELLHGSNRIDDKLPPPSNQSHLPGLKLDHEYRCLERVTKTRWLGGDAFVVVERGIVDALSQKYILRDERVLVYTGKVPSLTSTKVLTGNSQQQNTPEDKLSTETRAKTEIILADSFVFDRMDIILYGILSKNPHRIHWDREYAQQVEKYKDIVVQGPFMIQVLAIFAEWFLLTNKGDHWANIVKLKYRNANFVYPGVVTQIFTQDGKQFVMRDKENPGTIYAVLTVE